MKKTLLFRTLLLLCTLLAGVGSAHAEDFDYEWVETNFSDLQTGDVVVLMNQLETANVALPNDNADFIGVSVNIAGNKLSGSVSDGIQWILTKNGNTVSFSKNVNGHGGDPLYVTNSHTLAVGGSNPSAFTYENGSLSYNDYYIAWSDNKAVLQQGPSGSGNYLANFVFFKRKTINYVKWKKVDFSDISTGSEQDVVAIVDLTTVNAMSNDKGANNAPAVVAVELNAGKDRIMGSVADNIQWKGTVVTGGKSFVTPSDAEKMLIGKSDGLRVGGSSDGSAVFSISDNFLSTQIDSKTYNAGVKADFMSNTWELLENTGAVSDDIKNTQIAFFKKVNSPQKKTTLKFSSDNYTLNLGIAEPLELSITCTGAPKSAIVCTSSNDQVAEVANDGKVTPRKRGTVVITATVAEDEYHDKASATCTVRIDDPSTNDLGSINNPLTVAQALDLINNYPENVVQGVNYYIKGKVCKVNSGMMAMFGDMDFSSMGGGTGTSGENSTGEGSGMNFDDMMDDMDFDMDEMGDMGFDMSSMGFDLSAFFGSSDKVTYYISDDGVKDKEKQLKVLNGLGTLKSNNGGDGVVYNNCPKLSPGDCVVVCGPLVKSKDENMLSSLMGNGNDEETWKVGELNYLHIYDPTLLVEDKEVYVNKTLDGTNLYDIDNDYNNEPKIDLSNDKTRIEAATFKSSDEEIAKWDDEKNVLVGVNEGTAKITVKVKVILQEADDTANPKVEEKSYTMKRKFKLTVKTRDLDPAGYYDGDYVLATSADDLEVGSRLILVGTRVKDGNGTDYVMAENNAMMGGGKNGSKIDNNKIEGNKIPCENAPKGTLEVVLEKAEGGWYLNVGKDENDTPLYLYASVKKEESTNNQNQQSSGNNNENQQSTGTGGFNMDEMMEMFNPSSGLKVGTKAGTASTAAGVDSLKATIFISTDNIATIKFPAADDKNNTIMLTSSFDMEEMMGMFGGMGNKEEETDPNDPNGNNNGNNDPNKDESTFDMGSFDMFMASFNTKKPDETPETGKEPKNFMPRIYRFVPDASFDIEIGTSEWKTIVTYKDVKVPSEVDAYIVTRLNIATDENDQSMATLSKVENLKGGAPYLLHTSSPADYTLTLLTDDDEQSADFSSLAENQLLVSDRTISGADTNSEVYVLANKNLGTGFYQWVGGDLGSGRVYLPVPATTTGTVREFVGFGEESTAIQNIESTESLTGIFYDLQGRRVNNPTNGIYIVNGKKAIIK